MHKVEGELKLLKSSEELRIEVRKDILELQRQGYDPKIIDEGAPVACAEAQQWFKWSRLMSWSPARRNHG